MLLICAAGLIPAQNISCSLSGTVQDSTGAVFPGVEVKVIHTQTGFVRSAKTNHEGFFSWPALTPGVYRLEIAAHGFPPYPQSGIVLSSRLDRPPAPTPPLLRTPP